MKLKKGDRAKVIKKRYGHKFNIGDIVTILAVRTEMSSYNCQNDTGDSWVLMDDELKLVKKKK